MLATAVEAAPDGRTMRCPMEAIVGKSIVKPSLGESMVEATLKGGAMELAVRKAMVQLAAGNLLVKPACGRGTTKSTVHAAVGKSFMRHPSPPSPMPTAKSIISSVEFSSSRAL